MKKIMMILQPGEGGSKKHVCDLLESLDRTRFELVLIYNRKLADEAFKAALTELEGQLTAYSIEEMERELSRKKDFAAYKKIREIIKTEKPDVVHCHSSKAGVLGRIAAKRAGVKTIYYTPHGYSFLAPEFTGLKRKMFIFIERFLARHATTASFTVSHGEREAALIAKIDRPEKIKVIYNGIADATPGDLDKARFEMGISADDIVIGSVGRLAEQKNPQLFMEVARLCPEYKFIWIGSGVGEELERMMRYKPKNLHFLGYLNQPDLLMPAWDLYFSTSLYEGLPYAPIEALRAGVPLFLSDVVGNREVVNSGTNGELFQLGTAEEVAEQLRNNLKNLRELPTEQIRSDYFARFSITKMLDAISDAYEQSK
jgi:glycosyltransferase involved in cell wall biosynthesis